MARTKKSMLRPTVIFLIGIILIAISFTFWYFMISPVVSRGTYFISQRPQPATISNGSSLIFYFGNIIFKDQPYFNRSRPVDCSFNLSLRVSVSTGNISLTFYLRDTPIFNAQTNKMVQSIVCNSSIYNSSNPVANVFPNIASTVPISLLDALTGGTTPYMIVKNLNTTSASITYTYSYSALSRSSNGIPLIIFIIGAVIAVVEGVVLVRYVIRRVRQR